MGASFAEGKALHEQGRLEEAAACYRRVAKDDPERFKALNNLASILQSQGRPEDAVKLYEEAVSLRPDNPLLHFNLGHAWHQQGVLLKAIPCYLRAIELDPRQVDPHFNLATALHQQGRFGSAEISYRKALELAPELVKAQRQLGEVLFDQGRLPHALEAFQRAARQAPDDPGLHFDLAKTCEALDRSDDAIADYRRSLELNPRSSATHERLFRLLHKLERSPEAADLLDSWLAVMPDNPMALHLRAAFTQQDVPSRASQAYLRQLFDGFAEDFDLMLTRLHYRAPQLVAGALATAFPNRANLSILDAGCGTGLCGPLLRSHAKRLVGVDLSPAMLQKARRRNVYDDLVEGDLTDFLRQNRDAFDAVVSADTLVYFGRLDEVLSAAAVALRCGGRFIFTLEQHADGANPADYYLNPHGRYSHAQEYVRRSLEEAGLSVQSITHETLRREGGTDVQGWVVVSERPAH